MFSRVAIGTLAWIVPLMMASSAVALPRTWIGGNAAWDASIANWDAGDEPDADDEAIFNTNNTVSLANASESILALTMSGGIDLLLDGNDLTVNGGNVSLSGTPALNTLLDVPTNSALNTDDVFINADASLTMHGGAITMTQSGGDAVLTVAADGDLGGYGTITSTDVIAVANTTVVSIGGNLAVFTFDLFSQQAGTLAINVPANGRVDLDQTGAVIDITRNDTLDINGAAHDPAVDAYGGTLNLAEGATIDMSNAWGMNAGTINVNTNGINAGTAGAAATIAGAAFTQVGGTINLADNLDSLRFSAVYTATGGTINNNGRLIIDADVEIWSGCDFQMNGTAASITLAADSSLLVNQGDFDLGGAGNDTGNVTTIGESAALSLNMDFDSGSGDVLDQRIELDGGILFVNNVDAGSAGTDTTWHLSGGIVNSNVGASVLSGDDLLIQSETINIAAGATLFIQTDSVEITNPTINISGALDIVTSSHWSNSGVSVTGSGLMFPGVVTIGSPGSPAEVVWNVDNVDWDDNGPTTIVGGSTLTINANTVEPDLDGYGSAITIGDSGRLTVNLNIGTRWTLASGGTITHNGDTDPTSYEYLAGSDVAVNGTINHNGRAKISARLDIGDSGIVNILTVNEPLVMGGGDNTTSPNTIAGGTINGPGYLDLSAQRALIGFGTINSEVNVFGPLKADDGILNLNGAIFGDGILGTADSDGILNVTNAWNTTVTSTVELQGGELRGATITNGGANGINGHGLVSARIVNNTRIDAEGGTLIVESAANDNDWDGAGAGQLNAISGDLEIRDDLHFPYSGTVVADAGRTVLADGFELQFQPGSTLTLTQGTYSSIAGDPLGLHGDFGGTMTVNAGGPSRLWMLGGAEFLASSTTTLQDDLRLQTGATYVRAGATFTGTGALVNLALSGGLALEDGVSSAGLGVLLRNDGSFGLGKDEDFVDTAAQVSATDFEQTDRGTFSFELGGLGPDQFDRLDLTGAATLDGTLRLRIFGGYMPELGDTFDILTAAGGLGGTTFASVIQPVGAPAGRFFSAIYNPTSVQLLVISNLPGDYNNDSAVDAADYVVWRLNEGTSNLLTNDPIGGTIDADQYNQWRANYGQSAGSGSGASSNASVPESVSALLLVFGLAIMSCWTRSQKPCASARSTELPRDVGDSLRACSPQS